MSYDKNSRQGFKLLPVLFLDSNGDTGCVMDDGNTYQADLDRYTHMHIDIHTQKHIRRHTHKHTHRHICSQTYVYADRHTHSQTYTHGETDTHIHVDA